MKHPYIKPVCITVGPISTNCWLYPFLTDDRAIPTGHQKGRLSGHACAVIDPGDEADLIVARLRQLSWFPRYILITHGHFDHLSAVRQLLDAYSGAYPLPVIGIHRLDAHFLGKDSLSHHRACFAAVGGNPEWLGPLDGLPEAEKLFEDGDAAGPFKVLHLPGHSAGSAAFYDEEAGILFSGDVLFRGGQGRTDLPGSDEAAMDKSLKRLCSMDGSITVYPGHGMATTIKREQAALERDFR